MKEAETSFRAAAARSNYLSIDRPDCQFASKEICRLMTTPTRRGHASLKRLCRYLVGRPRLVHVFDFQQASCSHVYTDTDWAGCPPHSKEHFRWHHHLGETHDQNVVFDAKSDELVERLSGVLWVNEGSGSSPGLQRVNARLWSGSTPGAALRLGGRNGNRQETRIG